MKKLSEKFRKGLRKFYLLIGVTAISLLFQACYGMPMDDWDDDWDSKNRPNTEEDQPADKDGDGE